jgi:hypothetical protein
VQQTRVNGLSKVEGEALVTRFPIIETGKLDYQTRDIVALVARVVIEERTVDFYGTQTRSRITAAWASAATWLLISLR